MMLLLLISGCSHPGLQTADDSGFVQIFDGQTLDGWDGDPTYWRVEQGSLVGEVTPETILDRNTFLIWRGGVTGDFELKAEYRISEEGNSGINYRSEEVTEVPYALRGYQADLDGRNRYTGSNYEERKRTTLAAQGEKVVVPPVEEDAPLASHIRRNRWMPSVLEERLGDDETLDAQVVENGWNEYHIIAQGNRLRHYVNGVLMSDVTDNDAENRREEGLLGVQVHVGPPMKVEYRNFRLKQLD